MAIHELRGCLLYSVNTMLSNGAYEREGIYYCFVLYINVLCCSKPYGTLIKRLFSRQRNFTLVIGITALQMSFLYL